MPHIKNLQDEGVSSELAGLIGSDKMNEIQSSEKLREFYKKLLETDAQIRKLKQGLENNHVFNTDINNNLNKADRYKRSLKLLTRRRRISRNNSRNNKSNIHIKTNEVNRSKRGGLGSPGGFMIENKRVFIQYKPMERISKCSHAPKESKSHEKHRKHPFYQNSQRLDELLEHILDRNVPQMTNPLELDVLFSNKSKCSHMTENSFDKEQRTKTFSTNKAVNQNKHVNKNDQEVMNTGSTPFLNQYTQNITIYDKVTENSQKSQNLHNSLDVKNKNKDFQDHSSKFMAKIHENNNIRTTLKGYFDEMDKQYNTLDKISPEINNNNYRKLYDQNFDDNDKKLDENDHFDDQYNRYIPNNNFLDMMIDRTSTGRTFDMNLDYNDILFPVTSKMPTSHVNTENNDPNTNPTNEQISNSYNHRKLLQIDEGNEETLAYEDLKEVLADDVDTNDDIERRVERIKTNENIPDLYNRNWKGSIPLYPDELNAIIKQAAIENMKTQVKTRDVDENDETKDISDTDYIEDYFDNKYDRLVELAQAYSDYGVLDNKKEPVDQKDVTVTQNLNRQKMSLDETRFSNVEFQANTASPHKSEGIRFEIKPGKCNKDTGLFKAIRKHFKLKSVPKTTLNTEIPFIPNFNPIMNPPVNDQLVKSSLITQKVYTKNQGPVAIPKRGLKSVAYTDTDDFENTDIVTEDVNTRINLERAIGVNENERTVNRNESDKKFNNKSGMGASEFFAMFSDWFSTLAKLSGETTGLTNSSIKGNNTEEVVYPLYDSDMIENIGHRSRVLLSLENKKDSLNVTDVKGKEDKITEDNLQATPTVKTDSSTVTTREGVKNATEANIISERGSNIVIEDNNNDNKTISKRSLTQNSKFWNDIYDDEYGIKMDYFEKSRIDRQPVRGCNFVKRSKNWIGGKVKDIASKFRSKKDDTRAVTDKSSTEDFNTLLSTPKRTPSQRRRRKIRNINIIGGVVDDTNDFAALTANMKKVIREAVNAVKQTRNIKAREDNQEDAVASSLMQQLVGLMSDVVDFQVQKRTCSQLPPDLQKFLEWLISPSETMSDLGTFSTKSEFRYEKSADESNLLMPEDHLEDRTQCLGSIQAVQELMRQYDEMDEKDKSKMSGVKKYLENQLDFLNGKVNALDDVNVYKYYKKRETNRVNRNLKRRNVQKRKVRRIKRRIKNVTTRTTSSVAVTEAKKMEKN